jgi:hypothetical protein
VNPLLFERKGLFCSALLCEVETNPASNFASFLLGLHFLTIDGWRPGWDEEGWWLMQVEVDASMESGEDSEEEEDWKEAGAETHPGLSR